MKKKRAILVLVCALCLPLPSAAEGMDDMFGVMFRMMLVMMNVMSDSMLGNSSDFGSGSPLGFGMGSWPHEPDLQCQQFSRHESLVRYEWDEWHARDESLVWHGRYPW